MARPGAGIPMHAETMAPTVSAVLITRDAQARLRQCLESLAWCDEIVVVDGGSADSTVAICAEFAARVTVRTDWQGFGVQKNRAVALARCDWVLSIDADEVCSGALRDEIRACIAGAGAAVALELPRRSSFCGHWMRHGGWWPDYVTRVFRRGRARFTDDVVHERLEADGTRG